MIIIYLLHSYLVSSQLTNIWHLAIIHTWKCHIIRITMQKIKKILYTWNTVLNEDAI